MKKIIACIALIMCIGMVHANDTRIRFTCLPYLQNVTDTEATIIWATDRDAVSWVEIAPDDDSHFYATDRTKYFDTTLGKKNIGTLHHVTLHGLQPGTAYRYRVYSQEVTKNVEKDTRYGSIAATDVYRGKPLKFSTMSPDKHGVHFAVVNDIHENSGRYANLIQAIDSAKIDFMVLNGDMVNNLDTIAQAYNGFLNESSKLFATSKPFYMVRGNHETRGTQSQKYMDLFPTGTGNPYYAVRYGDVCFVMLDAGEDKPDSDIEYCGLAAFDRYRTDEAEWLKETVGSEMFLSAPIRIVCIHVPPVGSNWHGLLEVREKFIPILDRAGIDLMLCGHIHRHRFVDTDESGFSFPILINSNREILDITAENGTISVDVSGEDGTINKRFSFPVKR